MVLPSETEERVKRRALNACQDNLRKVVDVSRKIPQLAEYFASGDKENVQENSSAKSDWAKKKLLRQDAWFLRS